jgi:hypothetical protein
MTNLIFFFLNAESRVNLWVLINFQNNYKLHAYTNNLM